MRIFIFLTLLIVLVGCQNEQTIPDGFYTYEKSEIKNAISDLSFQPEIPEYVPMKVDFFVSDLFMVKDSNKEALDVSFYTRTNDLLSIQFIEGETDAVTTDAETVNINETIKGKYIDDSFSKVLYWSKDDITYKITYRDGDMEQTSTVISKSDLIKVAKSFQS